MVVVNIYMDVGCKFTKFLASLTNARRNNFSRNLQKEVVMAYFQCHQSKPKEPGRKSENAPGALNARYDQKPEIKMKCQVEKK